MPDGSQPSTTDIVPLSSAAVIKIKRATATIQAEGAHIVFKVPVERAGEMIVLFFSIFRHTGYECTVMVPSMKSDENMLSTAELLCTPEFSDLIPSVHTWALQLELPYLHIEMQEILSAQREFYSHQMQ